MPVNTPHREFKAFEKKWQRCRDAAGGTDAVKARGVEYLPMLEGHIGVDYGIFGTAYDGYLKRALFYPAVDRTIGGLVGVIFAHPPTVKEVSKSFETQFDDITQTGVSLQQYALLQAREVIMVGRVGTLVEFPPDDPEDDAKAIAAKRPYWVQYRAEQIINWRAARIGGVNKLVLLVLFEEVETPKITDGKEDPFEMELVPQYRVLYLDRGAYTVQLYREKNDASGKRVANSFVEFGAPRIPTRRAKVLDFIPFSFASPIGIDAACEHPPLLDLVDVDLSHYRTSADQEHGAHFTACPTPVVTGHSLLRDANGQIAESLAIGSGTAWVLPNPESDAKMLEFSGAGLNSLRDLKEEKRLLMITLGARMLETQKNDAEASQTVRLRHAGEASAIGVASASLGQHLSQCLRWHLFWAGVDQGVADKALIELNPEAMEELTAEEMTQLVAAWQAGAISKKTLYWNLQWGEWARPNVEFEEEEKEIESETPDDPPLDPSDPLAGAASRAARRAPRVPREE
jgi:hypothetical protein